MTNTNDSPSPTGRPSRRRILSIITVTLLCTLLIVVGIRGWEWSNSIAFCTNVCHDVHAEEEIAYQDSYHARTACTDCHLGSASMLRSLALKIGHLRYYFAARSGDSSRPLQATTLRPTNEACEQCHWPATFHSDRVLVLDRFLEDEQNSARRVFMILRTGSAASAGETGFGIHWHINNEVEYIATDDANQDIRWVRATLPDGRVVEFNDVTDPLSSQEVARADRQVMGCVDCHNRMGHPFFSPPRAIDAALADGRLSGDIPFIKSELIELLNDDYESREAALAAVESLEALYRNVYPEVVAENAAAIQQAIEMAQELVALLVFDEPGVTWQSFPNNGAHSDSPGCFRCHDGKHLSADGEAIRVHCNICHTIPIVTSPSDAAPETSLTRVEEPEGHLDPNFVADHRFQANEDCSTCHGDIAFGSDDSGFCANSVCHGNPWPEVDLDATFPHPIELEGRHVGIWCHQCHEGVEQLSSDCAGCHEPPSQSHYGPDCAQCHTPYGFLDAPLPPGQASMPMQLEGAHTQLACADCHRASETMVVRCADCHSPPDSAPFGPNHLGTDCENCHELTSFEGAILPQDRHPVPLVGAHQRVDCLACHASNESVPVYTCGSCHEPPTSHAEELECEGCHSPEGWTSSALTTIPQMPHALEGREDCLLCHDETGALPMPEDHEGRVSEECLRCHVIGGAAAIPGIPHDVINEDCLACHAEGGLNPVPADHRLRTNQDCLQCHEIPNSPALPETPSIPHELAGREECLLCHAEDGLKPVPDDHDGRTNEECQLCHQPAAPSHPTPNIPHDLEGRDDCLLCHSEGGSVPIPADHEGRTSDDCQLCHEPARISAFPAQVPTS